MQLISALHAILKLMIYFFCWFLHLFASLTTNNNKNMTIMMNDNKENYSSKLNEFRALLSSNKFCFMACFYNLAERNIRKGLALQI